MLVKLSRGLVYFVMSVGLLAFHGCSETDIPQTLTGSFINTNVELTTDTSPSPGSNINSGSTTFNLSIAFTLSEQEALNRQDLGLLVDFFSAPFPEGCNDFPQPFFEIGTSPEIFEPLSANSGIVTRSFTFNRPGNTNVIARVGIFSLQTGNGLFCKHFDWQVQ